MKKQELRDLISKHLTGKISRDEYESFLQGFDDKEAEQVYGEVLAEKFESLLETSGHKQDLIENRNNIKEARRLLEARQNRITLYHKFASGIAASIIIVIGVYFLYLFAGGMMQSESPEIAMQEKLIPSGKKGEFTLSDGTSILANAGSQLIFPEKFVTSQRKIQMEGEAYFDVKSDQEKPFLIDVGSVTVKVIGTRFNISAYENEEDLIVTVEEGEVMVITDTLETTGYTLREDQQLTYNGKSGEPVIEEVDASQEIVWTQGIIKFKHTPFAKVENRLERWYGIEIEVKDQKIYQKRLTGTHKNERLQTILESLKFALNINYEISDSTVVLR